MFIYRFCGSLATLSQELAVHNARKFKQKVLVETAMEKSTENAMPFHHNVVL